MGEVQCACDRCSRWYRNNKHRDSKSRARAIRAVVAAQWGVAIVLLTDHDGELDCTDRDVRKNGIYAGAWDLASLPCAVDLVDGGGA